MKIKLGDHVIFMKSVEPKFAEALWQYIIDHVYVDKNTGTMHAHLVFRNEADMYRRIHARYTGQFKRYEKLEKMLQQERTTAFVARKKATKNHLIIRSIETEGNLFDKITLWLYRKTKERLFGDNI